jgi:6-phosphogluconolactonase/glucosamine-6-phosphate isomerase/deaminase
LVYATYVSVMPYHMVTLGPTVLQAAKKVVLMISGQEKREIFAAVRNESLDHDNTQYYVQFLWPILDRVIWFIDNAAAPRFLRGTDGIV